MMLMYMQLAVQPSLHLQPSTASTESSRRGAMSNPPLPHCSRKMAAAAACGCDQLLLLLLVFIIISASPCSGLQTGGDRGSTAGSRSTLGSPVPREYCFPQVFNASCPQGHVVMALSARYGRMKHGRCVTSDYQIGCSADVLAAVDQRCSGRQSCNIPVPDTELQNLQPCPKDLFAYLEASYSCVRVEDSTNQSTCDAAGRGLTLTKPRGYLSSHVTSERGVGGTDCPWVISVGRGQQVNLTLFDFGVTSRYRQSASLCHVYASVTERAVTSEITVCGDGRREKTVYLSDTNTITVRLSTFKRQQQQQEQQTEEQSLTPEIYFLFHYEAVGCVDPPVPEGATLTRQDRDKAAVACNFTSQVWHLICHGTRWVGVVQNCTVASANGLPPLVSTHTTADDAILNFGLLFAILIGVMLGVIIGAILLATVICCHKRMSHNAKRNLYCSPEAALLATDRNYVERPLTAHDYHATPVFASPGPLGYSDYKMSPAHKVAALNDASSDVCCAACTTPPHPHPPSSSHSSSAVLVAYPSQVAACTYPTCTGSGDGRGGGGGGGGKQPSADAGGRGSSSHQSPLVARSCPHSVAQSPQVQPRQFASIRRPLPHHHHQQQQQQRGDNCSSDVIAKHITTSQSSTAVSREWMLNNNMADVVPRCAVRPEVAAHDECNVSKTATATSDRNNKSRDRRDPYGFEMMERGGGGGGGTSDMAST